MEYMKSRIVQNQKTMRKQSHENPHIPTKKTPNNILGTKSFKAFYLKIFGLTTILLISGCNARAQIKQEKNGLKLTRQQESKEKQSLKDQKNLA